MHDRTCLIELEDERERHLEFRTEADTQARLLSFVVAVCLHDVPRRRRCETEPAPQTNRFRRCCTVSQLSVRVSAGSARRRSNSSRCHGGTGTLASDRTRLSQISWTSCRRCSIGSSRICVRRGEVPMSGSWERCARIARQAGDRAQGEHSRSVAMNIRKLRCNEMVRLYRRNDLTRRAGSGRRRVLLHPRHAGLHHGRQRAQHPHRHE